MIHMRLSGDVGILLREVHDRIIVVPKRCWHGRKLRQHDEDPVCRVPLKTCGLGSGPMSIIFGPKIFLRRSKLPCCTSSAWV